MDQPEKSLGLLDDRWLDGRLGPSAAGLLHPNCAVCKKPVDDMRLDRNILTDSLVITLSCHGAREVVSVETDLFAAMSVRTCEAFTTQGLAEHSNAPQLQAPPKLLSE